MASNQAAKACQTSLAEAKTVGNKALRGNAGVCFGTMENDLYEEGNFLFPLWTWHILPKVRRHIQPDSVFGISKLFLVVDDNDEILKNKVEAVGEYKAVFQCNRSVLISERSCIYKVKQR